MVQVHYPPLDQYTLYSGLKILEESSKNEQWQLTET